MLFQLGLQKKSNSKNHSRNIYNPFISFYTLPFHFLPFTIIYLHFLSSPFISSNILSCPSISCHFLSFPFILFHFLSFPSTSLHFVSFPVMSFHFPFISFYVFSCPSISVHFLSRFFISFHFIFFHFQLNPRAVERSEASGLIFGGSEGLGKGQHECQKYQTSKISKTHEYRKIRGCCLTSLFLSSRFIF